jgi:hypothetical protein
MLEQRMILRYFLEKMMTDPTVPSFPTFPIDAVYTWVDGSDPAWLAERERLLSAARAAGPGIVPGSVPGIVPGIVSDEAVHMARFRDNGELRYSLRSLALHAPWIRRVHLVVAAGQKPAWINPETVTIVHHADIFPPDVPLPTFNSRAIEFCLHRIPDLAERFISLNDDFMFGRQTSPEDFFTPEGRPLLWAAHRNARAMARLLEGEEFSGDYEAAISRAHRLIRERFGRIFPYRLRHFPRAMTRGAAYAMCDEFAAAIQGTLASPFRSPTNLSHFTLFFLYALATGAGELRRIDGRHVAADWLAGGPFHIGASLGDGNCARKMAAIRLFRPRTFCLNDAPAATDEDRRRFKAFLVELFPEPCRFEAPVESPIVPRFVQDASTKRARAALRDVPEATAGPPCFRPAFSLPVDAVYTWVDGSDPAWLAERERVLCAMRPGIVPDEAVHMARFRDNGELRYSLRSLALHAPWIRRVHLVVAAGQKPAWINPDTVSIVRHADIFPPDVPLPTFNIYAIECCLHRIADLAEHFISLNDDFMFGRRVSPEDFFTPGGRPRFWAVRRGAVAMERLLAGGNFSGEHQATISRAHRLIQKRFGRIFPYALRHTPKAMTRSAADALYSEFAAAIRETLASPFRSPANLAPPVFFFLYALATGAGELRRIDGWHVAADWLTGGPFHIGASLGDANCARKMAAIRLFRPRTFCLNDAPLATDEDRRGFKEFLEKLFPEPCRFEAREGQCA